MKRTLLFLTIIFMFFGCSSKKPKELSIAVNSWIGYAPLFYAKEKGYLDKIGIKLITTVSLTEAAAIYSVAKADLVTTTQHEYHSLKHSCQSITPIILIDRSDGGDMILSNKSIKKLKKAKHIYAYLEIDSINSQMIKDFTTKYKIDTSKITYINNDQAEMQNIKSSLHKAIIIVTYSPYNISLIQKGFKTIASTKNLDNLLVIDAICTNMETLTKYKKRLKQLKKVIDLSISEIDNDTKKSYVLISKYLNNISYNEYINSLKLIKWINHPSKKLLKKIEKIGYLEENLIK